MDKKLEQLRPLLNLLTLIALFAIIGLVVMLSVIDYVDNQNLVNSQLQGDNVRISLDNNEQQQSINQLIQYNKTQADIISDLTKRIKELESNHYGFGATIDYETKLLKDLLAIHGMEYTEVEE